MKQRIAIFTSMLLAILHLTACSDRSRPDSPEPTLEIGEADEITRTEATVRASINRHGETIIPDQARSIASGIADALAYLHAHGAVHRDLKPANILISHHGDAVKMIDFSLSDSDGFFVLKNPAGSGKYIAPELLQPEARHTPEADIYSLGMVAGELAAVSADDCLAQAASICRDQDSAKRREGLRMLREGLPHGNAEMPPSSILASAWLTYPLAAICSVLAAFIIYHYMH